MKPAIAALLCGIALTACGGDSPGAPARPAATEPVELSLQPKHGSGVSGTASLVAAGTDLQVTVALGERVPHSLLAHIHTGPCSDEPTWRKPRIWASLTEVVDGRSETTVNVVTLSELQAEAASINVHDTSDASRPLVCGDIPRATEGSSR